MPVKTPIVAVGRLVDPLTTKDARLAAPAVTPFSVAAPETASVAEPSEDVVVAPSVVGPAVRPASAVDPLTVSVVADKEVDENVPNEVVPMTDKFPVILTLSAI